MEDIEFFKIGLPKELLGDNLVDKKKVVFVIHILYQHFV